MSDEEALGHIGSLHARWRALVNVLVAKGLVTQDEILAAVEAEASAQRAREDALDDERSQRR